MLQGDLCARAGTDSRQARLPVLAQPALLYSCNRGCSFYKQVCTLELGMNARMQGTPCDNQAAALLGGCYVLKWGGERYYAGGIAPPFLLCHCGALHNAGPPFMSCQAHCDGGLPEANSKMCSMQKMEQVPKC